MKLRNGFVSNSSSSSFVCDVCGDAYEIWDSDSGIYCENSHGICECHIDVDEVQEFIFQQKIEDLRKDYPDEDEETLREFALEDWWDGIPAKFCPRCNRSVIRMQDIGHYLVQKLGLDVDEIKEEMRAEIDTP